MCWGLEVSPAESLLNQASQSSLQFTITQQAVRDSGFVKLNHLTYSRDIAYSTCNQFLNLKNFCGSVGNPNNIWL